MPISTDFNAQSKNVGSTQQIQQETTAASSVADYPVEELREEEDLNRIVREATPAADDDQAKELKQEEHLNRVVRDAIPEAKLTV